MCSCSSSYVRFFFPQATQGRGGGNITQAQRDRDNATTGAPRRGFFFVIRARVTLVPKYTEKTLEFIEFVPSSRPCTVFESCMICARAYDNLDSIRPRAALQSLRVSSTHSEFFEKTLIHCSTVFCKKSLCPGVEAKRHARTSHIIYALHVLTASILVKVTV